jgi:hypothetical protein
MEENIMNVFLIVKFLRQGTSLKYGYFRYRLGTLGESCRVATFQRHIAVRHVLQPGAKVLPYPKAAPHAVITVCRMFYEIQYVC